MNTIHKEAYLLGFMGVVPSISFDLQVYLQCSLKVVENTSTVDDIEGVCLEKTVCMNALYFRVDFGGKRIKL